MTWNEAVIRVLRPYQFRGKHRLLSGLGVPVDDPDVVPATLRQVDGVGGLRFCSDNPRDIMFRALYLDVSYQDDVLVALLNLVRPGASFWDVGANHGQMSCFVDRFCGSGLTLHAFEPDPRNLAYLRQNLTANSCSRVHVHELVWRSLPVNARSQSPPIARGRRASSTVSDPG